ncbi:MAG: metallophosphoesterase [Promethearchaeota archaeon]
MDFSIQKIELPKENELSDLVSTFSRTMAKYPTVVDIPADSSVLYVGDLHGYFDCLEQALKLAEEKNADYVVFLGDYVDRGPKQIETILAIVELALRDEKFITLRGNHEDDRMNKVYGFYNDLKKVYPDQKALENIMGSFTILYEFLPLAAVKSGSGSLAVHGGIPKNPDLQLIRSIPKPHSKMLFSRNGNIEFGKKLYSVFYQILWNDPQTWKDENPGKSLIEADKNDAWFYQSPRGNNIYLFNETALKRYLEQNNLSRLIRGHESSRGAYENVWNGSLLHIFSASPYFGKINEARFLFEEAMSSSEPVIEVLRPSGEIIDTLPLFITN